MVKILLTLFAALLLMGQDCNDSPPKPPEGGTEYCAGNDYSILDSVSFGYEKDGVSGALSAILGGEPSDNRRATVRVAFGQGYCSGVAINEWTVLTAAHCGYAAETRHLIYTGDGEVYMSRSHLVHPDYWDWVYENDLEGRKADLMLLYMDDPLPPPYIQDSIYDNRLASVCRGLVAQGWGRWEGAELMLREAKYTITTETDKYLISRLTPDGKICFGDSGGPLYADVGGWTYLAGITTTTMSQDCKIGGTHVKVAHFLPWVKENLKTGGLQ